MPKPSCVSAGFRSSEAYCRKVFSPAYSRSPSSKTMLLVRYSRASSSEIASFGVLRSRTMSSMCSRPKRSESRNGCADPARAASARAAHTANTIGRPVICDPLRAQVERLGTEARRDRARNAASPMISAASHRSSIDGQMRRAANRTSARRRISRARITRLSTTDVREAGIRGQRADLAERHLRNQQNAAHRPVAGDPGAAE